MRPKLYTDVYPAISSGVLKGTLTGKLVLITGAAGGLGFGESIAFAKAGAKLALVDIRPAEARLIDVVDQCKLVGSTDVKGYFCDVTDENASAAILQQIQNDFGPVDILVNNAGGTNDRPFHMQTFKQFWSLVDLNLKAPLMWTHMLINDFRHRKTGTIINIASRSATVNAPFALNYNAAKAGLVRATGCLQLELDIDELDGIDVYSLHPGAVKPAVQKKLSDDVEESYPEVSKAYHEFCNLACCSPMLCGQTCVFIAAGKAKALRGRYFDCEQDIGYIASMEPTITEQKLYELKVEFLGGLPNDGGSVKDDALILAIF